MQRSFSIRFVLSIFFIVVLGSAARSFRNTSDFFNKQVGYNLTFQSIAGMEDIDWYFPKDTASIYYSLWQGNNERWTDPTVPLVVWLPGRPGGSSQFGCFNQIGPLVIQNQKGVNRVLQNGWSWHFYGHIMCVDSPLGVGFSNVKGNTTINNSPDAANHFINFLSNFFKNCPWNLSANPLYIAGENYSGHFIPSLVDKISTNTSLKFNLQGIILGNAFVDPQYQLNNFDSFLYSAGIISKQWRDSTAFMQTQAQIKIMNGDYKDATDYYNFVANNKQIQQKHYNGMSLLNYKRYDDSNINSLYYKFLQQKKSEFGVPDSVHYVTDNQQMYKAFSADISRSYKQHLERILNKGIRTLIYQGQNAVKTNTAGVLNYMNTLQWTNAQRWKQARKTLWKDFGNENLGWTKNYGNLYFTLIRFAGHLSSADQPRAVWLMLGKYFQR